MSRIDLVVTLVVGILGLWATNAYVAMDRRIKQILNVNFVVLWLLRGFGLLGVVEAMGADG